MYEISQGDKFNPNYNKALSIIKEFFLILKQGDTCFASDCDEVEECSHTGHGCYMWYKLAKDLAIKHCQLESIDMSDGAVLKELLYQSNEEKFRKDLYI